MQTINVTLSELRRSSYLYENSSPLYNLIYVSDTSFPKYGDLHINSIGNNSLGNPYASSFKSWGIVGHCKLFAVAPNLANAK